MHCRHPPRSPTALARRNCAAERHGVLFSCALQCTGWPCNHGAVSNNLRSSEQLDIRRGQEELAPTQPAQRVIYANTVASIWSRIHIPVFQYGPRERIKPNRLEDILPLTQHKLASPNTGRASHSRHRFTPVHLGKGGKHRNISALRFDPLSLLGTKKCYQTCLPAC